MKFFPRNILDVKQTGLDSLESYAIRNQLKDIANQLQTYYGPQEEKPVITPSRSSDLGCASDKGTILEATNPRAIALLQERGLDLNNRLFYLTGELVDLRRGYYGVD